MLGDTVRVRGLGSWLVSGRVRVRIGVRVRGRIKVRVRVRSGLVLRFGDSARPNSLS